MDERKFFKLQEGEKVVKSIKPKKSLLWYFLITGFRAGRYRGFGAEIGSSVITLIVFLYLFLRIPTKFSTVFFPVFFIIIFIAAFVLGLTFLAAYLRYKKQHYWITNKRVVYKRGIMGYKINSIPLERISDVIISRTFLERIFGFGSIAIQSMAGQVSRGRSGAEASLLAIPNPEETQELIFELIKRKRKREHITM